MPIFVYKAKRGPKETVEGEIEAENRDTAVLRLSESGLVPVSIELNVSPGKATKKATWGRPRKLGSGELGIFTQQLRTLIKSRVELLTSLNILHRQSDNQALREVILDLRNTVKDGQTFSFGLSKYPKFFPSLYVNIIKAGETSGRLDESLSELSEFLEKEQEFRMKVRSALAYPLLMIIVGLGTIFVLFSFIIPRLLGIFADFQGTLPLPTRILLAISNFMHRYWVFIVVIFVLIILFFQKQRTSKAATLDAIKIRLPIIGELIRKQSVARFSHTLSLLLHSGIPVFQALSIAIPTLENKIYIRELEDAYKDVLAGATLANSFKKTTFLPPFIIQMITVGEEGGRLEDVLNEINASYTRETETILKIITSLIEPLVILSLGLILGLVIIAILLPVFQLNMLIR
ncbi:MAG: hypothetical protein A3K83_02840 [Omnitrophica WOR_2 bacterium RBG_13_44_8b]|nr:MAG: hypothetical protein A3K83_02840 [Omnitrophica WOR_2 bacterium RBG_13_44_8b]